MPEKLSTTPQEQDSRQEGSSFFETPEDIWDEIEARERGSVPPEELATLIFESYRFSQGNLSEQSDIFRYIALRRPDISQNSIEEAQDILVKHLTAS